MELFTFPAITTLGGLLAGLYKKIWPAKSHLIPELCGLCGLVIALVCFYLVPGSIPADNAVLAATLGVTSGLAATGVHQGHKQMREYKEQSE